MKELTIVQKKILDYCIEHVEENNNQPTIRQIQKKFEWSSPNAAAGHLRKLHQAGYIEHYDRPSGKFRFTTLTNLLIKNNTI